MTGLTLTQISEIIPGGVPDMEERVRLVASLIQVAQENPELDVEQVSDVCSTAARALFADQLAIEQPPARAAIDRRLGELYRQREQAANMSGEERAANGLADGAWYEGAIDGLQGFRRELWGSEMPDPTIPF